MSQTGAMGRAEEADEEVLYEVADGVALLTLHRPERHNAWTFTMEARYFALLDVASADEDVRAIVVTGAGRSFCPGLDVQLLAEVAEAGTITTEGRRPQTFPLGVPKPLIAAVNGACAGIGLLQALMCDVRFVAAGAKLTTAFARRGLMAEHGITWLLARLIGPERALDLLLSGRTFTAEEAHAMGLVSRVLPAEEVLPAAMAYARELAASCSPLSMAVIKAQVQRDLEEPSLEAARRRALALMQRYVAHPDAREGVTSYVERRPPRFAPLPTGFIAPVDELDEDEV